MPAQSTSDVIDRLENIVRDSLASGSRLGYFAALYNRVTQSVRARILAGGFEDNPRMERLDVTFAQRYLDAYDQYRRGETPSRAWLLAFHAAERSDVMVLQHLLLAMNAHIDLDLGIAAAVTCPGPALAPLRGDFNAINTVLDSLVALEERQTGQIDPLVGGVLTSLSGAGTWAIGEGIALARFGAWDFACSLVPLDPAAQARMIGRRDAEVELLGQLILDAPASAFMSRSEGSDVSRNIEILAAGEFELPSLGSSKAAAVG